MKARVKDIVNIMESYFPLYLAEEWDNAGLQVGSYNSEVNKIMVALDIDDQILGQAADNNVDMIITHHPLLFKPVKYINYDQPPGHLLKILIQQDITVYSAHTNLDVADNGLNQWLAEILGLKDIEPLDNYKKMKYFKLVVFVPATHIHQVRQAINDAGAGYIGKYSDCSFRVNGTGTFMPRAGTNPYIGTPGHLEEVEEYRLETIVSEGDISRVLHSIKQVHPYEEAAYDLYPLANQAKVFSPGRKGCLNQAMSLKDFAGEIKKCLKLDSLQVSGDLSREINRVAVVSGSGASFIPAAQAQNMDVLVTGDLKYHEAKEASMMGIAVIDAGHQGTEEIMVPYIKKILAQECVHQGYDIDILMTYSDQCLKSI